MPQHVQIRCFFGDSSSNVYTLYTKPNHCPRCHKYINPIYRTAYYSKGIDTLQPVEVVWCCPGENCQRLFISYYELGHLKNSVPYFPQAPSIDEEIIKISPKFFDIYSQVEAAKSYALKELIGLGYRKALEILIKDFCIFKLKKREEDIKKSSLYNCIEQYCDGYVKTCAHPCRVLGNDETHYERRYEDRDINDLENLIKATLHWIGAELVTNSYAKT